VGGQCSSVEMLRAVVGNFAKTAKVLDQSSVTGALKVFLCSAWF